VFVSDESGALAAGDADELRDRIALQQPVVWQPAVLSPASRRL
jgi:hypothetical protein